MLTLIERLQLVPVINGVGPATRLGGLNLSENIQRESLIASKLCFRMDELHLAASAYIGRLLGVPGALVTAGAAAALTLATAVSLTGFDVRKIASLPQIDWDRRNVVILKNQTDPYDHAVTATGAMLRIVGDDLGSSLAELESALDSTVTAILWRPKGLLNQIELSEVGALAQKYHIPLIIDAAVTVPPIEKLVKYFADGASFVATSGGKSFRGPHTGGLLFTSKQNVINALLHHLDMDERELSWIALRQESLLELDLPKNGIGRAMKVGKEQIFAMVAAIDQFLLFPGYPTGDDELNVCEDILRRESEITIARYHDDFLNVDNLKIFIGSPLQVDDFYLKLYRSQPRIILGQELSEDGWLTINPMALEPGEGYKIAIVILQVHKSVANQRDTL